MKKGGKVAVNSCQIADKGKVVDTEKINGDNEINVHQPIETKEVVMKLLYMIQIRS